jgi:hypothetical protein
VVHPALIRFRKEFLDPGINTRSSGMEPSGELANRGDAYG